MARTIDAVGTAMAVEDVKEVREVETTPVLSDQQRVAVLLAHRKVVAQQAAIQQAQLTIVSGKTELEKAEAEFNKIMGEIVAELKIDATKFSLDIEKVELVARKA
jgi:hypothetical protein